MCFGSSASSPPPWVLLTDAYITILFTAAYCLLIYLLLFLLSTVSLVIQMQCLPECNLLFTFAVAFRSWIAAWSALRRDALVISCAYLLPLVCYTIIGVFFSPSIRRLQWRFYRQHPDLIEVSSGARWIFNFFPTLYCNWDRTVQRPGVSRPCRFLWHVDDCFVAGVGHSLHPLSLLFPWICSGATKTFCRCVKRKPSPTMDACSALWLYSQTSTPVLILCSNLQ